MKEHRLAYDGIAESYYQRTRELSEEMIEFRKSFIEQVPLRGKILDLACGPGRDAKYFSESGFIVVGADASPDMVAKAKQIAPKAAFHVMDMRSLHFDTNSFDGIFFCAGLMSVEKKYAPDIFRNLYRSLAHGPLFLSVKESEAAEFDTQDNVEKYRAYYTEEELKQLLEEAGFALVKQTKTTAMPYPYLNFLCLKA